MMHSVSAEYEAVLALCKVWSMGRVQWLFQMKAVCTAVQVLECEVHSINFLHLL